MSTRVGRRVPPIRRTDGGGRRQAGLADNVRLKLELLDERRFGNGMVYLYYRTRNTR